ncbi:MAG: hypothetical protein O7C58_00815, partial [Rickettsia endosymbiont of Ixodes persulcatus]|nr:hypothetical protein [Rickettsia endosymbiont of Ixodes persulcatus]
LEIIMSGKRFKATHHDCFNILFCCVHFLCCNHGYSILITLFLSLTTTSIYTIYIIIATTMRSIALILISSFREVFGY